MPYSRFAKKKKFRSKFHNISYNYSKNPYSLLIDRETLRGSARNI